MQYVFSKYTLILILLTIALAAIRCGETSGSKGNDKGSESDGGAGEGGEDIDDSNDDDDDDDDGDLPKADPLTDNSVVGNQSSLKFSSKLVASPIELSPGEPLGIVDMAMELIEGKIVTVGTPSLVSSPIFSGYFDVAAETWTKTADGPTRLYHEKYVFHGGFAYLVGNVSKDDTGASIQFHRYEVATDTWSQLSPTHSITANAQVQALYGEGNNLFISTTTDTGSDNIYAVYSLDLGSMTVSTVSTDTASSPNSDKARIASNTSEEVCQTPSKLYSFKDRSIWRYSFPSFAFETQLSSFGLPFKFEITNCTQIAPEKMAFLIQNSSDPRTSLALWNVASNSLERILDWQNTAAIKSLFQSDSALRQIDEGVLLIYSAGYSGEGHLAIVDTVKNEVRAKKITDMDGSMPLFGGYLHYSDGKIYIVGNRKLKTPGGSSAEFTLEAAVLTLE